jgi:hypothetical protein
MVKDDNVPTSRSHIAVYLHIHCELLAIKDRRVHCAIRLG